MSNSVTFITTIVLVFLKKQVGANPLCRDLDKCKFKKCQFSHTSYEATENYSGESNAEGEEVIDDNACTKCAHCNEVVDHDQHNLQECSKCEFSSKCWAEYNAHWQKTPDHIFSVDELREMGYQL